MQGSHDFGDRDDLYCGDGGGSLTGGSYSAAAHGSGASSPVVSSCVDGSGSVSSLLSQADKTMTGLVHAEEDELEREAREGQAAKYKFTNSDGVKGTDLLLHGQAAAPVAPVPFVGLVNEGCTCYLNSLLQMLFHLRYFRSAVYLTPTDLVGESNSIPRALQSVFHEMEVRRSPVHTKKLTTAFDWSESELYLQHDIQEMATLLRDNLEERMKGSVSEGAINRMFEGYGEQVVSTLDKSFCSRSRDTFYDIHLPLEGHTSLMDSLRSLTAKDMLVGDNKYRVEEPGKEPQYKDAQKSYEFRRFPPVIWFHLKRFEMDLTSPTLETKKVNSYLEFPVELSLEELERETPSNWGEYTTQVFSGSACDEKETDDDKEETRKKRKGDNEAAASIARPFSRDAPAIYDLQGVIVHKGSVRSGHYYCYIREWDAAAKKFTRWLEFDDERVTVVSQETAVNGNFGVAPPVDGRPLWHIPSNNAYMLSYVRRSDCGRMFEPPQTNIVPQCVRDQLQEEIQEEKRREEEANIRRRTLILYVITDEIISEHVKRMQRETFPSDPRMWEDCSYRVVVEKSTSLQSVYAAVAESVPHSKRQVRVDDFRLWLSPWTTHISVSVPLILNEWTKNLSLMEYLAYNGDDRTTALWLPVYLQRQTTLPHFYVPGTASIFVNTGLAVGASFVENSCTITFPNPVPVGNIMFFTFHLSNEGLCEVHVSLYATDEVQTPCEARMFSLNGELCVFSVNSAGQDIHSIKCVAKGPLSWIYLLARERPSACLPQLMCEPEGDRRGANKGLSLTPCDTGAILVFLKYFNIITGHIAYAGSVMIPQYATVADCGRVLMRLLGEDASMVDTLQIYVELHGRVVLLDNGRVLLDSSVVVGSVLIAQQRSPHLHRYTNVSDYLLALPNLVLVRATHCVFEEAHAVLEGSSSDEEGNDSSPAMPGMLIVESSIPPPDTESDVRTPITFYPPRRFHTVKSYKLTLDKQIKYEEVCEAIGTVSGCDPAYIRLYRGTGTGIVGGVEMATPEVDPAPTDVVLSDLVWGSRLPTIYFEVLQDPRRVVECRPRLIVTVRSGKGEAVYKEKMVVPRDATVGDVLRGILHRCATTLGRASSDMGTATGADNFSGDKGCNRSQSVDSETKNKQATVPFVLHSHYLVLAVDPGKRIIIDTVEVPVRQDGTCDCGYLVRQLVSQTCRAYGEEANSVVPVEPLTLTVVPATPLQDGEIRVAYCHGEMLVDREDVPISAFGQPSVVTVPHDATAEMIRNLLFEQMGVPTTEQISLARGAVLFPARGPAFIRWNQRYSDFAKYEERIGGVGSPSLLLNHRRPKEKPGSRYVAQASPALRISRK